LWYAMRFVLNSSVIAFSRMSPTFSETLSRLECPHLLYQGL